MKSINSVMRSLSNKVEICVRPRIQRPVRGWSNNSCRRQYVTSTSRQTPTGNRPLWTTPRVALVTTFVGSLVYMIGVNDAGNNKEQLRDRPMKEPVYASKKQLEQAISELQTILGEDAVSTDDEDLKSHGYSEWSSINIDQLPVVVVYPKSTEEVSQIAKIATKHKCPMIPYSGGSSLEANFSAPFGGISIDFAFMDQILAVHDDDMDVVVQPSVQWMELNEALKSTGLFFPVDPGPSAKIGGMVGTGCSGTNAFKYGTMKDWVLNLTVVLSDGRVIKTRQRPRKSSAGYNLNGIFVGAEGTLGIVTEATLKLAAIPAETKVGVVTFPTIRDAASASMQIIRQAVPVAAMEILDDVQMHVINQAGGTNRTWDEKPTLFFKFAGTPAGIKEDVKLVTKIAQANKGGFLIYASSDKEANELWKARKDSLWSMLSMRREGDEVWSTDVAVPISKLPDIIEKTKASLDSLNLFASVLGHIGDGNFHTSILYNPTVPSELESVTTAVHSMVHLALEMEGTCTGEHGIGLGKKDSLVEELGKETIDVMRLFKRAVDPHWIMNPGKVFDAVHVDRGRVGEAKKRTEKMGTAASSLTRPEDKANKQRKKEMNE